MAFAQSQKRSFLFILGVLLFYEVYIVASFSAPLPQSFDIVCANAEIVRTVLLNLTLDFILFSWQRGCIPYWVLVPLSYKHA